MNNIILQRLDALRIDLINHLDDISLRDHLTANIERIKVLCLEKETLSQLAHKQKTWDQKEENPVVQLEQESSTPSNDQKSQEKEQSQKIVKTNNKQCVISYPIGYSTNVQTGNSHDNADIAADMLNSLREGFDITIPNTFKLQVIDL